MTALRRIAIVVSGIWILALSGLLLADKGVSALGERFVILLLGTMPVALLWGLWWIARSSRHVKLIWTAFLSLLLASIAIFLIRDRLSEDRNREAEALARSLVPLDQIEMVELRIGEKYGFYEATGRVRNLSSEYELKELSVRFWLDDCPQRDSQRASCATIANPTETIYIEVPPGQQRDFSESLSLPSAFKVRGTMKTRYAIVGSRAQEPLQGQGHGASVVSDREIKEESDWTIVPE